MRNRFLRLRHHAVVCCNDQDCDVGHLRTTRAHGRERLVPRGVEECDLPSVVLDLVSADVLRDAPRLRFDDGRLANRVEKRRLAVVDMAHDRHDRRPRCELLLRILESLRLGVLLVGDVLDVHFALQLGGDELDLLVAQGLRRGSHLAESHQNLDDLPHRDAERLREVADRDPGFDRRRSRGLDDLTRLLRPRAVGTLSLLARVPRWASGGRVDDDAPLASAAGARLLPRAHRAVRFVWSGVVRHIDPQV